MIYIPLSRLTYVHFFEFRLCRWVIFMSSRGQSKQQTKLLDSKIGFPDLIQLTHVSESRLQLWSFSTMNLKLVNRLFHLFTASKLWFLLSYCVFFEWSFPRISYTAAISASARVQHWKLALQFFQATWKATIDLVKLALDVTRPGPPKGSFLKGKWDNLISGKSRLVKYYLGASFKYLLFSALLGEDSNFDSYFSNGLKPPTSYNLAW